MKTEISGKVILDKLNVMCSYTAHKQHLSEEFTLVVYDCVDLEVKLSVASHVQDLHGIKVGCILGENL